MIIRSPNVGTVHMPCGQYKQMAGRAGRAGFDTEGESILMLQPNELQKSCDLLFRHGLAPANSTLAADSGSGMTQLILSAVALELVQDVEGLRRLVGGSYFAVQTKPESLQVLIDKSMNILTNKGLLRVSGDSGELKISKLGTAVTRGSLDIENVNKIHSDLLAACQNMILVSYIHLLYIVVPYDIVDSMSIDMSIFEHRYRSLSKSDRRLCDILGITEMQIERELAYQGASKDVKLAIRRMGLAFVLLDLWDRIPLWDVAMKFNLPRGAVQNLLQSSAAFAGSLTRFCEDLEEFWALKRLLPDFARQLMYCINAELIPLMELQVRAFFFDFSYYTSAYRRISDLRQRQRIFRKMLTVAML